MSNTKSICFTGHRNIRITEGLKYHLKCLLEKKIKRGVTDFYAGGAIGFDTFCEYTVIDLKRNYPGIKLHLILPCIPEEQTAGWSKYQKNCFNELFCLKDDFEYISLHYTPDCLKKRNARLIELSDECVCYYSGNYRSGTGQTVRMAENKGIPVINLYNCSQNIR